MIIPPEAICPSCGKTMTVEISGGNRSARSWRWWCQPCATKET